MSQPEAYLPETRTSGRADVTIALPGGYRREYEDHFVRVDATSRIVGVFEPEDGRPIATTSLANAVVEWRE